MQYVDFSLVVEGLVATGMQQTQIARKLGVSKSTVGRWLQGMATPRFMAADALLELAEQYTARRLESLRRNSSANGT